MEDAKQPSGSRGGRFADLLSRWAGPLSVLGLCVFFWTIRVMATAHIPLGLLQNDEQYTKRLPYLLEAARRWSSGEMPLWNPWQLAGTPFLATPLSATLYPPTFVACFLPIEQAMFVLTWGHVLMGGLFAYALARGLGVSRIPAVVCGFLFPCCGYWVTGHFYLSVIQTLAWTPLLFLAVLRIHHGGGARWCGVLALAVSLQILASHQDFTNQSLLALATYAAYNLLRTAWGIRRWGSVLKEAAWVGGGVALGMIVAAPQMVPTFELVSGLAARGVRGLRNEEIEVYGPVPLGPIFDLGVRGNLGFVALALAPLGLLVRRLRSESFFFLGLGILAYALALGSATPVFRVYRELPWGRLARDPTKFLALFCFAGACAAALGCQSLLEKKSRRHHVLVASIATGVVVWLGASAIHHGYRPLLCVLSLPVIILVAWSVRRMPLLSAGLLCGVVFFGLARSSKSELMHIWQDQSWRVHQLDAEYDRLEEELGWGRFVMQVPMQYFLGTFQKQGTIQRMFRFEDAQQFMPKRYADYVTYLQEGKRFESDRHTFGGACDFKKAQHRRLLEAAGVSALVDVRESPLSNPWGGESIAPEFEVERLPEALPRAFIVHGVREAVSEEETLRQLAEDLDLRREAIVEAPPPGAVRSPEAMREGESVTIESYAPEEVVLSAELLEPGVVVLLDVDFPGWRVEVNGREEEILNVNYLFRGLFLKEGSHRIVYRYAPASVRYGFGLGAAGLFVTMILLASPLRLARRETEASIEPACDRPETWKRATTA